MTLYGQICLPMKTLYLTLLAMQVAYTSFANTIKAVANGPWDNTTSWSPARLPQDNDTIVIPTGDTITLDNNVSYNNVAVKIYGALVLTNGKLRLDNSSSVIIGSGGSITGFNSNDQIKIGSTAKYNGRDGTLTGPLIANSSTGTDPSGFVSILPVIFQSFNASPQNADVFLTWTTSQETNNSFYAIERSADGVTWKQIGVIAGAGTSNLVNHYSYTDKNGRATTVYYRLRQEDLDGSVHYSAVRVVTENNAATVANIFASSKQAIAIDCSGEVKNNVTVQLINMSGQIIKSSNYQTTAYRLTLNSTSGNGIYVVHITDGKGWSVARKIAL